MRILRALAIIVGLAAPAGATTAYMLGPTISTSAARVTQSWAGVLNVSSSPTTISTPVITLDGQKGSVSSPSIPVSVRKYGAKGDGATDDTAAIIAAVAASKSLYFPPGGYVITSSIVVQNISNLTLRGESGLSYLINKAPASNPSIALIDTEHFLIDGLSITGRAGFPNKAIFLGTNGGQQTAFGTISNSYLQPNGIGIEIQKSNTINIKNVSYWISGSLGNGATTDSGTRKYAVFVDSSVSGNFANSINIEDCNFVGIDNTISGAAEISMKVASLGSMDNIVIRNCELEGIGLQSIDISTGENVHIIDNFVENSSITINASRYSSVENSYNPASLTFTGNSVQLIAKNMIVGNTYAVFGIGSGCDSCGAEGSFFENYSDSGTRSYFNNVGTNVGGTGHISDTVPNFYSLSIGQNGTHITTVTASGYFMPPYWTIAQIRAATPAAAEIGGIVVCTNCSSPYSVCQSTGATIQGFRLGTTGTTGCN